MDRQQYIEKVIHPKLYRYCSSVIDQCMEEKALLYIDRALSHLEKSTSIPDSIIFQIRQKIERQQAELEIFKSKTSQKTTEKAWLSLDSERQTYIKKSLHKAIDSYRKVANLKRRDSSLPVKVMEKNVKDLLLLEFKREITSPPNQEIGIQLLDKFEGNIQAILKSMQDSEMPNSQISNSILAKKLQKVKNRINHASNQCHVESAYSGQVEHPFCFA